MSIQIIYWNVAYNRNNAELVLQDSHRADMVVLQEPWTNNKTEATHNSKKYHTIYNSGRAVLYVYKRHALAIWMLRVGMDWCSVIFREGLEGLIIWSIYSKNYIGADWQSLLTDLTVMVLPGRHILVRDFNLHHPI